MAFVLLLILNFIDCFKKRQGKANAPTDEYKYLRSAKMHIH